MDYQGKPILKAEESMEAVYDRLSRPINQWHGTARRINKDEALHPEALRGDNSRGGTRKESRADILRRTFTPAAKPICLRF